MKGFVQWNPVYGSEDFASSEARTREQWEDTLNLMRSKMRGTIGLDDGLLYGLAVIMSFGSKEADDKIYVRKISNKIYFVENISS